MWTLAEYEATALFSLKLATATSSGGRTLLLPTPYAIKMALLDVLCRTDGVAAGRQLWSALCTAPIALRPVPRVVISNTFTRILKPPHAARAGDSPYIRSIGYREYAYWQGALGIAIGSDELPFERLSLWLLGIQSLGKRGSFVQLQAPPRQAEHLPEGYIPTKGDLPQSIPLYHLLQRIDDCAPSLTFDKANIYSEEKVQLGKDRLLYNILLPYQRGRATRGYTEYLCEQI
jgi:hypothetical protein